MFEDKVVLERRLKAHTTITSDDHWLWTGYLNRDRYGQITVNGKGYHVNRLSAYIYLGLDLSSILQANHKDDLCRHRNCWNPEHLYIGTKSENETDKIRRNVESQRWGCGHPRIEENTYHTSVGRYTCKVCHNSAEVKRRYRAKKKASLQAPN